MACTYQWSEAVNVMLHIPSLCVIGLLFWQQRSRMPYHVHHAPVLLGHAVLSTGVTVAGYYALKKGMLVLAWPSWLGLLVTAILIRTTAWAQGTGRLLNLSGVLALSVAQVITLGLVSLDWEATYAARDILQELHSQAALVYSLTFQVS